MLRKFIAEFIGTFFLVFFGTGAIIVNTLTGALGHIGVALAFGMVVMILVYGFGSISGAHLNPVVSLVFAFLKLRPAKEMLIYSVVQFTAAAVASLALLVVFTHKFNGLDKLAYLGSTLPAYSSLQSFVMETISTYVLVLIILNCAVHIDAKKEFAGAVIGLTVALLALVAGPICGASMNPARSFGPALISGQLSSLWIYFLAPLLGGILAALTYRWFAHVEPVAISVKNN